jgi:signal transduction histidine kinase
VPAVELLADRRLLRQALLNLIGNAAKFTPKDGVVTVEAELERTGILEIRVRDHGPGIPADAIHRVTLPFVQADDTLSRRHEGSGLGLYLAKSFMNLHGGDLELTCPDSGGTIATIKLPASRVGSEEASANQ